ncbi:MAG: hypothetical protein WDA03_11010 [Trueperaceae bacterium]
MVDDHTQLLRAVANVLWPFLRAGERGWKTYRETRLITPTGNPRSGTYSSARQSENPSTYVEVLSVSWKIIATLWADDWPGGQSWRITLDKNYADAAISRLNAATIADYETALELSNCRKPFQLETDENGEKRLTRNRNDGLITNLTAAALEALAGAAELRRIPSELEATLFSDADEHISLDAIRAALQLAGSDEP